MNHDGTIFFLILEFHKSDNTGLNFNLNKENAF